MIFLFEKVWLFFVVFNFLSFALANEDLKDDNIDRGSRSDRAGLWFGPRLGKRSLRFDNDDNRQTFLRLLEAADALKYYYDQLQYYDQMADEENKVSKKVIFTPKLGRSLVDDKRYESVDFTPRLGRRLADEMLPTMHPDSYRSDPEQMDSRSKYFSPRLGRTMNFSPRLGRELAYDIYSGRPRIVRSASKTKAE